MRWCLALTALAAGCLVLYLTGASGYDLLTDDEMRYAEAGRRMVESGDWVVPEYNGYPRYQKPILFYWLQAIAQGILGSSPWSARLPTAVAGTLLVLLMAAVARQVWGQRAGWWSGVVLAIMAGIVLLSRMVMTDIVLLLFLQAGLGAFYVAQLREPPQRGPWYLAMWTAFAFGFLTKGPIAYVLPFAFLVPWLAVRGELLATVRGSRILWGLMILLIVAGPWYLAAHIVTEGDFSRHFFVTENLGRFLTNVNPHDAPPFLYFLILIPLTFPWAGLLPQVVRHALRQPLRGPFQDALPLLLVWQAVLVFVVFTLSRTRVWTYTLPMLPPLALLIGRWIADRVGNSSTDAKPMRPALWVFLTVALLLGIGSVFLGVEHLPDVVRDAQLIWQIRLLAGLLVVLSLLAVLTDQRHRMTTSLTVLSLGALGFYLTAAFTVIPTVDELLRKPVRRAAEMICRHRANVIVTCHVHELGLNFLTGERVVLHWRTHTADELADFLRGPGRIFVLIAPERWQEYEGLQLYVWDRNPRFVLAANFPPESLLELAGNTDLVTYARTADEEERAVPKVHGSAERSGLDEPAR